MDQRGPVVADEDVGLPAPKQGATATAPPLRLLQRHFLPSCRSLPLGKATDQTVVPPRCRFAATAPAVDRNVTNVQKACSIDETLVK